ncbi:MAG: hypothetical protein U0931_36950 [Vulcanimicrobiota bacterium]
MRLICLWLCLAVVAWAEGARDWVVTISDLKGKLPEIYRYNRRFEKFEEKTVWTTKFYRYEYFDRRHFLSLSCHCTRHPSSFRAQVARAPVDLAFSKNKTFTREPSVAAGEESACYRFGPEAGWIFTFREKKVEGTLILIGAGMKAKDVDAVADAWLARIRTQTGKKPATSKGFWFLPK